MTLGRLRPAPLEVRAQGILLIDDRILLARHARRGERYWVLPGGHRERAETLEGTLVREFEEEVGVGIRRHWLFSISEMFLEKREVLDVVFRVVDFQGEPRIGDAPATLGDRSLEGIELHRRGDFAKLEFRPRGLTAAIERAWSHDDWTAVGYLGNLGSAPV